VRPSIFFLCGQMCNSRHFKLCANLCRNQRRFLNHCGTNSLASDERRLCTTRYDKEDFHLSLTQRFSVVEIRECAH